MEKFTTVKNPKVKSDICMHFKSIVFLFFCVFLMLFKMLQHQDYKVMLFFLLFLFSSQADKY